MDIVDSASKNLEDIRPVPKLYESKRVPRARPPSLLYTSPESMRFIKNRDKDVDVNFEAQPTRTRKKRKCTTKKDCISGKPRRARKARSPRKVNLKPRERIELSESELEIEEGDFAPVPRNGELGKKGKALPIIEGRDGFICPKCSLKHDDPEDPLPEETRWVFCPVCEVVVHTTCIVSGCVCKYKPLRKHLK